MKITMSKPYVVITRPEHQGIELQQALEGLGFFVLHVPSLKIIPKPIDECLLRQITSADYALFISPASIESSQPLWSAFRAKPVFAMGSKSAALLKEAGFLNIICPKEAFTAEALLALPELQGGSERIVIIRGQEGRKLLTETLYERGYSVEIVEAYVREPIIAIDQKFSQLIEKNEQVLITITNESTLSSLNYRVNFEIYDRLKSLTLLVSSPRLEALAREKGFIGHIVVAANASDEAIIESIQRLFCF